MQVKIKEKMKKLIFIVNPAAKNGFSLKAWKKSGKSVGGYSLFYLLHQV